MAKIAGVDVLVYVDVATVATVLGGQSGATLNRSTNVVDTTSKDASGWAENVAGVNSWSVDCDGFMVASDAAYAELETKWMNRQTIDVEIRVPSGKTYSGTAIIADFPAEFPQDGAATFSISLTGTGALASAATV